MDVSSWLRDLGLEDYAQAFQANHIDAEVLPRLGAEDLIALGITSIGHRRKLLEAIAKLQANTAPTATEPLAPKRPAEEAERRQLTVVFCASSARPSGLRASIPRTCAGSWALSTAAPPRPSRVRRPHRQVSGRRHARLFRRAARTRTTPSGRCARGLPWSRPSRDLSPSRVRGCKPRCGQAFQERPPAEARARTQRAGTTRDRRALIGDDAANETCGAARQIQGARSKRASEGAPRAARRGAGGPRRWRRGGRHAW
jgi:SAM domain (Sterile alpha motif)